MRTLLLLSAISVPLIAAEPLLKPVAVPASSTRVQFALEGESHHVAALIGKPTRKQQTGSGEKTVPGKIALGTFMQAPVVATVKRLEALGYTATHMQTIVIPEITLIGRTVDSKGKPAEVKVKLKDVPVLAQLYVFTSDDASLDADLWMRVDVLLAGTPLAKAFPRVWLGETHAMAVTYANSAISKVEDDKPHATEPAPTGPEEGRGKITLALTNNFTMPCVRLDGKAFVGAGANRPVAGFVINNSDPGSLIASKGLEKLLSLKKANDEEGARVFADGKELKIINGKVSDLRFTLEGSKTAMEFSGLDQPLLIDQETEPPVLWVGSGYLRSKLEQLTLAGDSTGWKLFGYAKTESITPPMKEKKK